MFFWIMGSDENFAFEIYLYQVALLNITYFFNFACQIWKIEDAFEKHHLK